MPSRDWIRDLLQLKRTPRSGWFRAGLNRPESVADHSFSMALLAWQLARKAPDLDENRVLLMALLHDFQESRLTDIPNPAKAYLPEGAVEEAERRILKEQWQDDEEALAIYEEFRAGVTEEAKLVKAVDHLEFLYQAAAYLDLGHRFAEVMLRRGKDGVAWGHPLTRPLAEELLRELDRG